MRFMDQAEAKGSGRAEWALVSVLLLAVIYTAPVLFLGQTYFFRDLYQHFLPQQSTAAAQLRTGELPLWDADVHGGFPLLADPNSLALHPATLLYVVLSPLTALNLEIVLHLVVAMVAMWFLGHRLGLSPPAALAASAVFGLAGVTLSLVNLLNHYLALALAPLLLLAWHCLLCSGRRRWLAAAIAAGLYGLFAGGAETTLAVLVTLGVLTVVHPYRRRVWTRMCLLGVLAVLLAGLYAVQLLPASELVAQSVRGAGIPYASRVAWSLAPQRLPELVIPSFMGRVDTLAAGDYWGAAVQDRHFPYLLSVYFGALTLLLAGVGMAHAGPNGVPRRTRRALAALVGVGLLLALGRHLPVLRLVWKLPGVELFRFPVKWLVLAVLPLALLAGGGIDALARSSRPRRAAACIGLAALGTALVGGLLRLVPAAARAAESFFFTTHGPQITAGLGRSLLHVLAVLALGGVVMLLRSPVARAWGLAAVVAADLMVAGLPITPHAPRALFEQPPPLATLARRLIGGGRLFRDAEGRNPVLRAPDNRVVYQSLWNLEVLNFYLGAYYRLPVIFHEDYDRLASRRMVALGRAVHTSDWGRRCSLLSASGVALVVTSRPPPLSGLEPVARVANASDSPVYLYRNPAAVARARFVARAVPASDATTAVEAMLDERYDPAVEAVIEGAPAAAAEAPANPGTTVTETRLGTAHRRYHVHAPSAGYLVLDDPWYAGWRVRVDGEPVELLHADAAFGAVALSPGNHVVEQRYWPASFVRGAICSLAFIALAGLAVSRRRLAGLGLGPGSHAAL